MKHKLDFKIAAIFSAIIFVIIGSYFMAFRTIYVRHELKLMGEESLNTLQTMKTAVMSVIETANNYSKIILSDEDIQRAMGTGDIYSDPTGQSVVTRRIYGLLQFAENIDSVYLIDNKRQIYATGDKDDLMEQLYDTEKIAWYQTVMDKDGAYSLVPGGKGMVRSGDSNQICLIRAYKNLDDLQNLGIVSVNIDIKALQETYREILDTNKEEIMFLNESNQIICRNGLEILDDDKKEEFAEKIRLSEDGALKESIKLGRKNYLVTGVFIQKENWKIIRVLPLDMKQESIGIMTANVLLVMFSAVLILCGTVFVSNMITRPIQKMMFSMKKAEKGEFEEIEYKSFFGEFRYLFDGYNQMLGKIDLLLKQTIEKQKIIRKVELNEMQEQMKPHFLYNTLDSIEALIMMEENDKACEIVEALGDFFQKIVSKGRDMLTVQEEVSIVWDYIKIMKIRFADMFTEELMIDECCAGFLIPKLTLQPLVENAIHHGLREREEKGHLWVRITMEGEWVHLKVADDGIGISPQLLKELEKENESFKGKSFGLPGTIERMKIIYGEAFWYEITSKKMELTDISFYIRADVLEVY